MPVILATREAEIRRIEVQSQALQMVFETLSQNTHHKKGVEGLAEWLTLGCLPSKHEALSSIPTATKKEKQNKTKQNKKKPQS
jgi:hypothetical protein